MKIEEMEVFKKSHTLVLEIYNVTSKFPREEMFGLTSQLRRAAYSIPMNLVEGNARSYNKEYRHFVAISIGSCAELKYQIKLTLDLNYISNEEFIKLNEECLEVYAMLIGVKNKLEEAGGKK